MMNRETAVSPDARLPIFTISCWLLGLMGFSQVLVAGMALAARFEDSREVRTVIKEVPKIIAMRVPDTSERARPVPAISYAPPPTASLPLPAPTPVSTPSIADPRSERLVKEARKARVAGDNMQAIVKLEEALSQSPEDPSVHYELGLIHEQMGVFDKASAHFEKVFKMGVSGAGSLYELAANKLRDGFTEDTKLGKLSLGRVRIFNDPSHESGKHTILTIPVQKAPGEEIDVSKTSVEVIIFNRTHKGEIVKLEDKSWAPDQWINLPCNWANGEENLRVNYTIPSQDLPTEHLFGEQSYYGQVVILYYDGQVLDVQAWPRELAARIPNSALTNPDSPLQPEFQDTLPPDFDPSMPLLPIK